MTAVIFEVLPNSQGHKAYLDLAASLHPQLEAIDVFLSIERFESLNQPGKRLSFSFWRDGAAVATWRNSIDHRQGQSSGRSGVQAGHCLRVAGVVRDDSPAPAHSRRAHDPPDLPLAEPRL